ncbi:MAG TPA: zf-TFIIB domain-containing protein [Armatimonadota bacterium]|nr:zf-TFIIB domain-containing protein [Armatimonadota bacterium]
MNCPVCDTPLRAIQKYGVEIDICPGCKGVWLDRGELEKIIAMAAGEGPSQEYALDAHDYHSREAQPRYHDEHRHHDDDHDDHHRQPQYDQHGRPYQKRRGSWLGDLLGGFGGDD